MDVVAELCMRVGGARVLMDDPACAVVHWTVGVPKLIQSGAVAVDLLRHAVGESARNPFIRT